MYTLSLKGIENFIESSYRYFTNTHNKILEPLFWILYLNVIDIFLLKLYQKTY